MRIIKRIVDHSVGTTAAGVAAAGLLLFAMAPQAKAGADPAFTFYGYGEIAPNPNPAIANENTQILVTVSNVGDATATNTQVKLSFNDWGVTFQGWQEIGTVTVPSIAAGGSSTAEFNYVFRNRAHTCLEALIVSANDNPNNDRGQINMEVVNSGESFQYYVPIVNNGDAPIHLQVQGGCKGQDAAGDGTVPDRCAIDEQVDVDAGEELLIPVVVRFPPGTPEGTVMDVVVDAFDPADPFNVNTRNHVLLRVIYSTPRGLIKKCLTDLRNLPPLPPPAKGKKADPMDNKIAEIAAHIEKSLQAKLWLDDSHLAKNAAGVVYAQDLAAITQALNLVDRTDLPLAWKVRLDACARALTDAGRILLQTAIADAGGNADGEALLLQGDDARQAGDYTAANRYYHRGHVTVLK